MSGVTVQRYQSRRELALEHPEYKSLSLIHQAPRGQSAEVQLEGLRKAMLRRGKWSNLVFQIGEQFWAPAETTPPIHAPKEPTLCHES